ncbi:MAG: B12-binding domain-containing radical SAM protein [Candidatus Omnitrophica bacterium]|nr:B12-binding domain-containing radical SAM protein [Candidatus Omnitrophota bacterium]
MNVLFTNTYYQKRVEYTSLISIIPPLDLAYCAALIRQEEPSVHVIMLDANALKLDIQQQVQKIDDLDVDIIVFTATTYSINAVKVLIRSLTRKPRATILIGTHGSALPEQTLQEIPGLDIIICGEPEHSVLAVIQMLKSNQPISQTRGISFRMGEHIISTGTRSLSTDLDTLPFPARDLLPNDAYFSPYSSNVTALQTTRGCPGQCTFCDSHLLYGSTVRTRNPLRIVDEMEECVQQYKIRYFAIIDHTFTVNQSFVVAICNEIIRRQLHVRIRWVCNARADLLDNNTLSAMKQAGCLQIGVGIESGENERLRSVKKEVTEEQIKESIDNIRRHGMLAMGYAIIGFPYETIDDINKTKERIFYFNPHTLQLSFATPLPGSPLFQYCRINNLILSDNWDDYLFLRKSIIRNDTMTAETLNELQYNIVKTFYFRPKKLFELFYLFCFKMRIPYSNFFRAGTTVAKNILNS